MIDQIKELAARMRAITEAYLQENVDLPPSTQGFCIAASLALQHALTKAGYRTEVVRGRFNNQGMEKALIGNQAILQRYSPTSFSCQTPPPSHCSLFVMITAQHNTNITSVLGCETLGAYIPAVTSAKTFGTLL